MDPARMFKESLTSRPELENSLGPEGKIAMAPGTSAAEARPDVVATGQIDANDPERPFAQPRSPPFQVSHYFGAPRSEAG